MDKLFALVVAGLVLASSLATAQHSGHGGHAPATASGEAPSTAAFRAANTKMHEAMSIPYSGNADVDFIRGMIPHHQGAIDMAKIVLQHGKDPAVKKLAREIIKAQESEIAMMQGWLKKNAK